MKGTTSIKIGDLLFRKMFPLYNVLYGVFKRRQDKREISVLRANIKKGDVVLDIGANIGFYTRILSEIVGPEGHIYAFEPDRKNFLRLQKNCGKLGNVTLENKAVSHETGVIRIYTSPMLNVDHRTYPVDDYESIEEIPCVALDEYFASGKRIDFIKIDIQGFEVSAFSGMKRLLVGNTGVKIISEFWPHGLSKAGQTTLDLLQIFWDAGLRVYFMGETDFSEITRENYSQFDNPEPLAYMNIFVTQNM